MYIRSNIPIDISHESVGNVYDFEYGAFMPSYVTPNPWHGGMTLTVQTPSDTRAANGAGYYMDFGIGTEYHNIRYTSQGQVVFNMEWVESVTWYSNYVTFVMKNHPDFPVYWRLTVKSDGKKFARNDASLEAFLDMERTKLVFTIPNWSQFVTHCTNPNSDEVYLNVWLQNSTSNPHISFDNFVKK